jgi:hypothetical protein
LLWCKRLHQAALHQAALHQAALHQAALHQEAHTMPKTKSLPAGEVERLIVGAIRDAVATPAKLLEMATDEVSDARQQKQLLDAAALMTKDFEHLAATRVAFLVRRTITRIVVRPGALHIELVPHRLIDQILGRDQQRGSEKSESVAPTTHLIVLRTSLKRIGKEMRLVVGGATRRPDADPGLMRLMAQAQEFKI